MSYQPPGPPPPPSPAGPSRGRRTTVIIVAVVLAVVLLCCVGVAGGGFWLYRTVSAATEPARDATTAHFDALSAGDYAGAYQRLCQDRRDTLSETEYVRQESAAGQIAGYDIVGVNVSTTNGRTSGAVTVEVTYDGGAQRQETVRLVEENGEWRVCQ
ncbi:DUF4878 domain-containing protein [Solwaraspora sp. WMMD792]|uniref:Rv0361 family membrane protein n=1 Tax=Solwaraspora sp. WMMD792 TaxID=3016099 RepID=UPI0024180476|nr:DUF4878 domain-containing protein [Solwaraspora sp. WMMD792]MDG4770110.1 DUF4878 domain-containing protein [Solwaraspora sp. WMMD792]